MNIFQKLKFIVIISLGLSVINPVMVYAQQTSSTLPKYNAGVDQSIKDYLCTPSEPADGHDLERCINRLYRFTITTGALVLVAMLIFAGYMYITAGESGKTKAKSILLNAVTGLGIILTSYVLLYFINPSLVVIKPIQPPIFDAPNLPSCEEVGFGTDCEIQDGDDDTSNSGAGWGARIPCPSGQIVSAKGLGLPTKNADEQICKPFGEKLLGLKSQLSGMAWRITDTIGDGHKSSCHKPGNPLSGTCADIGLEPQDRSDANWNKVCKAVLSLGDVQPINEVIGAGTRLTDCPKEADYARTGSNVHVNWRKGGGGSTTTSTTGGSRPYCIAIHKFLCAHPSEMANRNTYQDNVWKSPHAEIQKNLDELNSAYQKMKKDNPKLDTSLEQVYRPPEYSAHMRSVYEAYALLNGWSDSKISTHGQYCTGSIQFVKSSDVKNLDKGSEAYKYIMDHFNTHFGKFGGLAAATTCSSDHGKGIALDFANDSLARSKSFESAAVAAGLCHNIPPVSWDKNGDGPHYILKSKANGAKCTWP